MPTFYNYTENGIVNSFDDIFVPEDAFRQGNLWVWGSNTNGNLGNNTISIRCCTPVTTFAGGINWKDVSANGQNSRFTAGIKTDGTLWTWGSNSYGQLGNNTTTQTNTPIQTFTQGTNWKQISCGGYHISAIKTDGTLWNWGFNYGCVLGVNDGNTRCTPVTTFAGGSNWKQVSSGNGNVAAIKTDGTLWCWGNNSGGQLGTNDFFTRSTPVTTFAGGTNWKQVSVTDRTTAAIKNDGTLWTWGQNNSGQLGINDTIQRITPVTTFAGGTDWKQVSAGGQGGSTSCYTAAIKTDGTLWTWGNNITGKLGDNTTTQKLTPITTFSGGTNWKQVSAGRRHSIAAIKTDGTLWTWGENAYGQSGTNTASFTINICTPVTTFAGGTDWKQVSAAWVHMAAITYANGYI